MHFLQERENGLPRDTSSNVNDRFALFWCECLRGRQRVDQILQKLRVPEHLAVDAVSKFAKIIKVHMITPMGIVTQTGQGGKGMRRIKTYKKWSIWRLTAAEAIDVGGRFAAFLPETDPGAMDEPEWAADSVQELIDFIDSYET